MKTKKITFNMIASKLDTQEQVEVRVDGVDELSVMVSPTISLRESLIFVADIVESCISDEEGYMPELFDFAMRIATLTHYANLPTPKDSAKAYRVVYETGIYDDVMDHVNADQYAALVCAAQEKIDAALQMQISAASAKVEELVSKMDEVLTGGMEAAAKLSSIDIDKQVDHLLKMHEEEAGEIHPVLELVKGDA